MTTDGPDREHLPPDAAEGLAIVAAGGIVLDGDDEALMVLVIHRPAYDDWSLPKGHVDPGEDIAAAALREVTEETGIRARIVREVGTTQHAVRLREGDARKVVHWFVMRPDGADSGDPADRPGDDEVDLAEWWPTEIARQQLTHAGERELLARALDEP
jgi:ADP-ribose pyrophosphatase YjhB (NUDIX family)